LCRIFNAGWNKYFIATTTVTPQSAIITVVTAIAYIQAPIASGLKLTGFFAICLSLKLTSTQGPIHATLLFLLVAKETCGCIPLPQQSGYDFCFLHKFCNELFFVSSFLFATLLSKYEKYANKENKDEGKKQKHQQHAASTENMATNQSILQV
jgi:hypothetical protein